MKSKSLNSTVAAFKFAVVVTSVVFLPLEIIQAQAEKPTVAEPVQQKVGNAAELNDKSEVSKLNPSRFAISNIEQYTLAQSETFSMNKRIMDPFGFYQDEKDKPVQKPTTSADFETGPASRSVTPLSDIVKKIKITTIMPTEKSFLVKDRLFKESDTFNIVYSGKSKPIKVVKVTASEITFQDLETKAYATMKMEMLPPGMLSGDDKLQPPGMVSTDEDRPLEVD